MYRINKFVESKIALKFYKTLRIFKFFCYRIFDFGLYVAFVKIIFMIFTKKNTRYPNEVIKLENDFNKMLKVMSCFSTSSGTTAYETILFALDAKKGDLIYLPACTFHSIQMTTMLFGLEPLYLDRDKNLDVILPIKINKRAKFFVVTHLFGVTNNLEKIVNFCKKNKLTLIEDCSHSHGAFFNGKLLGTFGTASFFSLQGDKSVAAGEGGIAAFKEKKLFEIGLNYCHLGRKLINTSKASLTFNKGLGKKYRMAPLGAPLARNDLKRIFKKNNKIKKKIQILLKYIGNAKGIRLAFDNYKDSGGYHIGIPFIVNDNKLRTELLLNKSIFLPVQYIDYSKYNHLASVKDFEKAYEDESEKFFIDQNKLHMCGENIILLNLAFLDTPLWAYRFKTLLKI